MAAKESETDEEAFQNLQYMQQIYQGRYSELSREINAIIEYINELNASKTSLDNFDKIKNSNILLPIESSILLNSKASSSDMVLVSIGAGYLLEKDHKEASEHISSIINEQSKNMQGLLKERNKAEDALFEIAAKMEKILKQE